MEAWQKAGTPGKHHEQLAAFVGSWDAEIKFWMDPSAEPLVSHGTIDYEMVMGGRYLREKVASDFMGQPFKGLGYYGYNNVTGKVQAVWLDDMSTGIYSYSGSLNDSGDKLVLTGKYQDPVTNEWRTTKSVMRVESPDRLHYVSYQIRDGEEIQEMEIIATRKAGSEETMDSSKEEGAR